MNNKFKYYNISQKSDKTVHVLDRIIDKEKFITEIYPKMCPQTSYIPSIMDKKDRIIVFGDIHGDYQLTIDLFRIAGLISVEQNQSVKWIGGSTYVVQVGDQIDRCRPYNNMMCDNPLTTQGDEASDIRILKLFNDLHKQAIEVGGAVISLLGNHELMNSTGKTSYVSYKGFREFDNYKDPLNPDIKFESGEEARQYAFQPGNEFGVLMGCSRYPAVIIGSHLFVHAGIINSLIEEIGLGGMKDIETINIAIRMWLMGLLDTQYVDQIVNFSENSMFWTRILGNIPPNISYKNPVCIDNLDKVLQIFKVGHITIGHTPQSFTYSDDINQTCDGKIFRVDNGSSSAFHHFDNNYTSKGQVTYSRRPQVLEIINDGAEYWMIDGSQRKNIMKHTTHRIHKQQKLFIHKQ